MNTQNSTQVPELGLVCITASQEVRFRALTRKRLLQLTIPEQEQTLRTLYTENLKRLNKAVEFCTRENIHLYRLSSALFPFADEPIGMAILMELAEEMELIGKQAHLLGLRLVLHPDQFVVLSSDRPEVIENSIKILKTHALILDLLGLPRSPWSLMNIHGGKGDRAQRLIQVIQNLPDEIRLRLTLENDEYAYSSEEILEVCHAAQIPMVFDAHHHVIHEQLESYDHPSVALMLAEAQKTWTIPEWQLVHISNGDQSFADPKHSDYISLMPDCYKTVPWIEVEAKQKELAIAQLRTNWLDSRSIVRC
ncbi:UV DNA damage endonuclease [Planktothrix tepida]|uniref:UV DNA damage endonuclease n=1 Tax=Planktothrix tepida PCC 9214 TaxID=671072 RepID=A0A1J1LKT2_9CYAN|nr:UV DNA damage repair endonuclease UvsE [Planktothrix tepida]CAD5939853.1 UV DNA damage endonuclease [Planktothrix tepida]CUR33189.1 UV DNA damage endonuclease [Planktothrix tepida PCC 9214]